ncbi:MAG: precorrin-3B C(17)-methyltransferase [Devosia sp.]
MKPAIIIFAAVGKGLAERLVPIIDGEIFTCGIGGEDGKTLLPRLFGEGRPIVGICAAGILIRLLAPHLSDKQTEPPVLAISQDGLHIVPLLGGHHGANALAKKLSDALGATAAITTASESKFTRALDEPPDGWTLADPRTTKPAMLALLAGGKLLVEGHAPWIVEAGYPVSFSGGIKVRISESTEARSERELLYHPRTLIAGIGAERGVGTDEVIKLIEETLASQKLSRASLAALASVDLKADERAFHEAAQHFGVPLRIFSVAELNQERYRVVTPSEIVEAETGTPSVAEAAALKAGSLLVPKHKSARATCAIGKAAQPVDPMRLGRSQGVLHVVGVGPGDQPSRTVSAVTALTRSGEWVGYGLYLDLVTDLAADKQLHRFALGDEEARVRHALELASTGKEVALICSGDAQIYAMGALVFELLAARGERAVGDNARRVEVELHPGISAFQAASAASGALIGHDFCCVSLSDLLTPREDILKRLTGGAAADFVTALYNPRSEKRTDLLDEAVSIFGRYRQPDTPVVVAASLGRPDEKVTVTTLGAFDATTVDMLTIVLIGSSASRAFKRGDGHVVAYTPRGYARKATPDA